MPDPKVPYPFSPSPERPALSYGVLEPGLQAAIDLLKREALNEKSAGEIAEGKDAIAAAMEHAHHYQAYMTAIELLQEQMARLKGADAGRSDASVCNRCGRHHDCCVCYARQADGYWPGHPGEAG